MGRAPCCEKSGLKKGPWIPEEDQKLIAYIQEHGHGNWRTLPKQAGLLRCGKSCRLRWTNYLRPDIKRGKFSTGEDQIIIQLHALLGNRWSAMAARLPGRTDNEIKNYWNTHLKKRLVRMGIDPVTHRPNSDILGSSDSTSFISSALSHMAQWENARLEAEARLTREYLKFANFQSALEPMSESLMRVSAANDQFIGTDSSGTSSTWSQHMGSIDLSGKIRTWPEHSLQSQEKAASMSSDQLPLISVCEGISLPSLLHDLNYEKMKASAHPQVAESTSSTLSSNSEAMLKAVNNDDKVVEHGFTNGYPIIRSPTSLTVQESQLCHQGLPLICTLNNQEKSQYDLVWPEEPVFMRSGSSTVASDDFCKHANLNKVHEASISPELFLELSNQLNLPLPNIMVSCLNGLPYIEECAKYDWNEVLSPALLCTQRIGSQS